MEWNNFITELLEIKGCGVTGKAIKEINGVYNLNYSRK